MSFEIFLTWFRDGEADYVHHKQLRQVFGNMLISEDEFGWRLSDGDVYFETSTDKPDAASNFSVHHPSAALELWDALYNLLTLKHGALFCAGGGILIANPETTVHLPADMVKVLGKPIVVTNRHEIRAEIEAG